MRSALPLSSSPLEVFWVFLKLGLSSFGGPVAHLGYFRAELVQRRQWLSDAAYSDLVALCQVLPGPASSQVGMGVGLLRAGGWGLLAAWLGFTLPSAALMFAFALGLKELGTLEGAGWLAGLKLAAVAVVAQAVSGMARTLTPDAPRSSLAVLTAVLVLVFPVAWVQPLALILAGVLGARFLKAEDLPVGDHLFTPLPRRVGAMLLACCGLLLLALPLLSAALPRPDLRLFDGFYRSGALVFGGGHVVLPLLQSVVVPHFMDASSFVAGYGAVQAVPGPLFTFAAYLGAAAHSGLNPVYAATLTTVAVFLPAALLVAGALPFWNDLRGRPGVRRALSGLNAGVVGLLLAALYTPVFTSAVHSGAQLALALAAWLALVVWKLPPWAVVLGCAGVGLAFL
ncbi:chromate efflux transporter [Deinococcus sp. KNUC1210]|uniref:chromate efflux transporter n=1 Tax=Deinococcus sp. KNUC1210 TaxID=2917691 RepID=UPI001EF0AA37|nr:chromate efflux transporter [Deinococcus sp. KNUC1210]ULH14606.1 chromate efflux transporter [Deinococcus sp. KNUC1210]